MHISSKQIGIASVEAVLIFPIMLLLFLIMLHVTKAMMTNIDVINESRLSAWGDVAGVYGGIRLTRPVAKSGETIDTKINYSSPPNSTSLIDSMRLAGAKKYSDSNALTKILDDQKLGIMVSTSTAGYKTTRGYLNWTFDIEKKFALVATPIWTAKAIPYGYDKYLKDNLDSKCLFTEMYPKVGPHRTPDCKKWF